LQATRSKEKVTGELESRTYDVDAPIRHELAAKIAFPDGSTGIKAWWEEKRGDIKRR